MHDLPPPAQHALQLMASEDWLQSYAEIDGIADVLQRMARRARQPNPLAGGEAEFLSDADGFTADFSIWLADARKLATEWVQR
jgi:acyl carrier protein phosphodiesterase